MTIRLTTLITRASALGLSTAVLAATVMASALTGSTALAQTGKAFTINGKSYSMADAYKENKGGFYDLDKKKFELIESLAQQKYLDQFWQGLADKNKTTREKARLDYLSQFSKVTDAEVDATLLQFKDNKRLAELPKAEQRKQVRQYLEQNKRQNAVSILLASAEKKGDLVVHMAKPVEPRYEIAVTKADNVKYGPKATDTKPKSCKGDDCKLTIVEYSEFQCPFCVRVLPTVARLLKEYEGQIRWIVRDFPLNFHDRAKPAAVASHCAGDQGMYWQMYEELFKNQRNLSDDNFIKMAEKIKLKDMKGFKKCLKEPAKHLAKIDKNYRDGMKVGVTGTPAFYVNGRKLSGAIPYESFKQIFEEELKKAKKSS